MRFSEISLSFQKEMLEVLRDKRALLITLALPVLVFPIFELSFALMANRVTEQSKDRITRVCIQSPIEFIDLSSGVKHDYLGEFKQAFESSKHVRLLSYPSNVPATTLILKGLCDVVLCIGPQFSQEVEACKPAHIELFDSAYSAYGIDEANVIDTIKTFSDAQRQLRLAPYNIPKDINKNVAVNIRTIESDNTRSGYWTAMVFTLMMIFVMSLSSMYPALDVITGERERGTLILLLMAPGDRRSYVCGKLLTVSCVTAVAGVLSLISVIVSLPLVLHSTHDLAGPFRLSLPIANVLLSSVFLPPIAVAISATALVISSYAKTFQQGQSYFGPLVLFGALMCGLILSCEESAPFFVYLMPFANLMLCMFKGIQGTWNPAAICATICSSIAYLTLLIRFAVSILDREESLFGIKEAPSKKVDYNKDAFLLFACCVAAFFYATPILQTISPLWGLLFAQVLVIGLPSVMVPKLLNMPVIETLRLKRPSISCAVGAILLAPLFGVLSTYIARMQSSIMPDSEAYIKALQDFLIPKGSDAWTAYVSIALAPAICEELLFRGALQGMLRKSLKKPLLLCLVVAVLFGIMHGSSYRFLPTALMGFILALLAEFAGSIIPGMLLHGANNALAVFESSKEFELSPIKVVVAASLAAVGILALYKSREPTRKSSG